MKKLLNVKLLILVLAVSLIVAVLARAPWVRAENGALEKASQAIRNGDWVSAAKALEQAAQSDPGQPGLWEQAGRYALAGNEPKEAVRLLNQASRLSSEGQLALGDAYASSGDLPAALVAWQTALPLPAANRRLAEAYQSLNNYPAAIDNLKALLPQQANDAGLYWHLGLLLAATRPVEAPVYLEQAASLDASYAPQAGVLQKAINAGRISDEPAYLLLSSGRALAAALEWEYAAEAFRLAVQDRPDYAEAWAFWGEAWQHIAQGKTDPAGAQLRLEHALAIDTNSISANTFLSVYWQRQNRDDLARQYLERAISLDPKNPALQIQLGALLAASGDLEGGMAAYQAAVQLVPADPEYWLMLASYCIEHQSKVHEIGLPAARQALALDPNNSAALDSIGQAMYQLEDYANAERFFIRAIQMDSEMAAAHLHLGMLYLQTGRNDLARYELTQANQLAPASPSGEQAVQLMQQYLP